MSIVGALALPALIGFIALAGEYGRGLVTKTENQRVADLAAYAAAVAYNATNSTTTMTSVAQYMAVLNGLPASSVAASLVTSPRTSSDQAVLVRISTTNPLLLAPVLGASNTLAVGASAYAQLSPTPPSCMLALSTTGNGVALTSAAALVAPYCTVASNNSVSVQCGDYLSAKAVLYDGAPPSQYCFGISAPISMAKTADPFANNGNVSALQSHVDSVDSNASPAAPSYPTAPANVFQNNSTATLPSGCSGSFSNATWTLNCAASGTTYSFGAMTVASGVTVNVTTNAGATYTFSGPITNNGALSFGAGTFDVAGAIIGAGSSTTSFGAGTFNLGSSPSCTSSYNYSVCNKGGSMTFGGPSTFSASAGVYNAAGSLLVLGSGSTNSFSIGSGNDGNAINLGAGAVTTFADATGPNGLFNLVGNFSQTSSGCTTISAAAQHDIKGNFNASGGLTMGTGTYSATGYFAFGASGGSDVTCNGSKTGVSGTAVTLVTEGEQTISGGSCNGSTFCLGGGFTNLMLVAPTAGTGTNLILVGPNSSAYTGGASFTNASSKTFFAGSIYYPYGPLLMTGGASIGGYQGRCFQLVASQITLSNQVNANLSTCYSGSSSSTNVALVQ